MKAVLIRLEGPMQSWGITSRFTTRDTGREPSKSGVLGLVCAAMGIERGDERAIANLAALAMGVRVDREGVVMRDYQTAGGGRWPGRDRYGVYRASGARGETVVSTRYYLADASFLVGLEGDDRLVTDIHHALKQPVWPLYLGRKGYVPSASPHVTDGLVDLPLHQALREHPQTRSDSERLRFVFECDPEEGTPRFDVPVSYESSNRSFRARHVHSILLDVHAPGGGG